MNCHPDEPTDQACQFCESPQEAFDDLLPLVNFVLEWLWLSRESSNKLNVAAAENKTY